MATSKKINSLEPRPVHKLSYLDTDRELTKHGPVRYYGGLYLFVYTFKLL